jgi:hypothetical protein
MRIKISITLVVVAMIISILACNAILGGGLGGESIRGSGMVTEESRELANITGVQLAMQGTLHIMLGSSENLRIEAEDNLMEYIQTNLRASNLVIETRQGINLNNTRPIDYYLTVKRLNSIVISSSGDIDTGDLQSDSFSVTINSSGNLSIGNLDCSSLSVEISSSGNVTVSNLMSDSISVRISSSGDLEIKGGQVQNQNITISSSGEYRARSLTSVDANVTLTSSGKATIRVSDHLSGRLSSSGDIYYIGSPDLNVSTSSSGRAVKISD